MALTLSNVERSSAGGKWRITGTMAFDASYPTGGEALAPSLVGLDRYDKISIQSEQGYIFEYDHSNEKVKAFISGSITASGTIAVSGDTAAGTSHVHSVPLTDNSATPVGVAVYYDPATDTFNVDKGAGGDVAVAAEAAHTHGATGLAAALTGAASSEAALSEVDNAADLSALTAVNFEIIGL